MSSVFLMFLWITVTSYISKTNYESLFKEFVSMVLPPQSLSDNQNQSIFRLLF